MSTLPVNPTVSSSSNFQAIFSTAVKAYEKRTKKDLLLHPLASRLQKCDSPASILTVLQGQVEDLDQARNSNERLTKWLIPTVNVLLAFSDTLGEGVSLVRVQGAIALGTEPNSDDVGSLPRESDICRCRCPSPGLCLIYDSSRAKLDIDTRQAVKDVNAAQEALIDIFERIENFFKRMEKYMEVKPSEAMKDIIVKIMVEVLNIFAIATKEMRQGRTSEFPIRLQPYRFDGSSIRKISEEAVGKG